MFRAVDAIDVEISYWTTAQSVLKMLLGHISGVMPRLRMGLFSGLVQGSPSTIGRRAIDLRRFICHPQSSVVIRPFYHAQKIVPCRPLGYRPWLVCHEADQKK